jgi:hypothetical protein
MENAWYYTFNCHGDPIYIGHKDATRYAVCIVWPELLRHDRRGLSYSQCRYKAAERQRAEAKQIVDVLNKV